MTRECALEPFVLQRLARLEPDLGVRRGRDGERGAAELVVLARARAAQARVALSRLALAPGEHGGRERVGADLDAAADRARPALDRFELAAQPVRRGLGIGVGGGDQAVGLEQRQREVHARPARVADAAFDVQDAQAGERLPRAALGVVAAAVEHEDHRERRVGVLRCERAHAGSDQLLLVVRWNDDARADHGSGAPCSTSALPRS